jgi:hypothetical protein
MVPAREATPGTATPPPPSMSTAPPSSPMGSVQIRDLSDDARVLLRLLSRRTSLHHAFSTADVLALTPNHHQTSAQSPRVPMSEQEITAALHELSHARGWLGSFRPGSYVFRALARDLPEEPGNTDRAAQGGGRADGTRGQGRPGEPWARSRSRALHHRR